MLATCTAIMLGPGAWPACGQQGRDPLSAMSIDSLLNVPVAAAARYSQTIENAPASVSIVTADQIERFGYRTLEDVLQSVRGFYTSYDRNYSYIGVRGFSRPTDYNNRILLLFNGQVLSEGVYNLVGAGTELGIELSALERIEIVRGPGSALYGTGAIFAVINLVTKEGALLDGARLSATVGSAGQREVGAVLGDRFGPIDVLFASRWGERDGNDLYFPEFDDPAQNSGIAAGLDWDRYREALAVVRYGGLRVQARANRREKGIPTGAWGVTFNDPRAGTIDEWASVAVALQRVLSPSTQLSAHGDLNAYIYSGRYPASALYEDATDSRWASGEIQLTHDFGPANRLVAGIGLMHHARADYRAWDPDTVYFAGDYPYDVRWAYVQDELQLAGRLTLVGGLRYDGHSTSADVVSPRFAILYAPRAGTTLKALWGRAFRAPSVYEQYYEGDDIKRIGSLDPEHIHTTELIWQQRVTDGLFVSSSLFHYHLRELIDTLLDPADSIAYFANRKTVRAIGGEIEVNGRFGDRLSGYASYSVQQSVDTDTRRPLTNSPAHMAKTGASAALPGPLAATTELRYESGRTTVYDTRTPAVLLADAGLTTAWLHGLRATARVHNAFNSDYATPGGYEHVMPAIRQDGRRYTLHLEYRFR